MAGTKGNCYLCGAEISKGAIKNHILKKHGGEGQECALLKVEGAYDKDYWLYIDVPLEETLEAVDAFLRDIWLECCDHMSAFSMKGKYWDEDTDYGKEFEVGSFPTGTQLIHEYDFGSTTKTLITFMGEIRRPPQKEAVRLLTRNVPPKFPCAVCGAEAEFIDTEVIYSSRSPFFCAKCAKGREAYLLLPVTNSPRMGVCAYDGAYDHYTFSNLPFGDERP